MNTTKPEQQIDFVNEENDQTYAQRLLQQKALSVVSPLAKLVLLETLKEYTDRGERVCTYEAQEDIGVIIETIKFCLGWQNMSEGDKQKINNYLEG